MRGGRSAWVFVCKHPTCIVPVAFHFSFFSILEISGLTCVCLLLNTPIMRAIIKTQFLQQCARCFCRPCFLDLSVCLSVWLAGWLAGWLQHCRSSVRMPFWPSPSPSFLGGSPPTPPRVPGRHGVFGQVYLDHTRFPRISRVRCGFLCRRLDRLSSGVDDRVSRNPRRLAGRAPCAKRCFELMVVRV